MTDETESSSIVTAVHKGMLAAEEREIIRQLLELQYQGGPAMDVQRVEGGDWKVTFSQAMRLRLKEVSELVAAEREACAKVADEEVDGILHSTLHLPEAITACGNIAAAIRRRGEPKDGP